MLDDRLFMFRKFTCSLTSQYSTHHQKTLCIRALFWGHIFSFSCVITFMQVYERKFFSKKIVIFHICIKTQGQPLHISVQSLKAYIVTYYQRQLTRILNEASKNYHQIKTIKTIPQDLGIGDMKLIKIVSIRAYFKVLLIAELYQCRPLDIITPALDSRSLQDSLVNCLQHCS